MGGGGADHPLTQRRELEEVLIARMLCDVTAAQSSETTHHFMHFTWNKENGGY